MANATRGPRRRQLPHAEELKAWREFTEAVQTLRSEIESRLLAETSLSAGDYAVMLALSEAPGQRMRSSELAAEITWERSRLSHHLGRMQRRGLIRRDECATDSRGAEVVLTTTGGTAFRDATVPHLRAVRELFVDAFTADQLDATRTVAAALRAHQRHQQILPTKASRARTSNSSYAATIDGRGRHPHAGAREQQAMSP